MNVLFVINQIPENPEFDGITRWFFNTLRSMRSLVEKIDVVGQAVGPKEKFAKVMQCSDQLFLVSSINHAKYRYKWFAGWDYAKIRSYNPLFIKLLQKLCMENPYDLIILVGHGTHVNLPYIKAKHIMVAPLDAPSGVAYASSDWLTYFKKVFNDRVIHQSERSYNSADSVLVVSDSDKEILRNAGVTTKIIINPISVDTTEFFPQEYQLQTPSILFTGVLNFHPNIDAVMHLVNDIFIPGEFYAKGIVCRIAGRSSPKIIKDLSKIEGVEIFENLPDLRPIFRESLIYVAPMRTGLGMKTKILEAMAMAKPIIGYPLTFNGINYPEQFALVCNSPREIIDAINSLSQDICLRKVLGGKARDFAEHYYSVDQNIKVILNQTK
jgi:glycosyltransferase involved in cell wall biosynthesis